MSDAAQTGYGAMQRRDVDRPGDFRVRAWWRVARRVAATMGRENFTLIAAGCAFYALLALAPSFAALATLYGFFSNPGDIADHLALLETVAPPDAYALIADQANALDGARRGALGWASVGALLFAVWSARAGVRALMSGVALAYREKGGRGFLLDMAATYLLTLLFIAIAAVALGVVVLIPTGVAILPIGEMAALAAQALRWPVALGAVLLGLGALYRYAPPRRLARRAWITPGAVLAIIVWLLGSVAFSLYLSEMASYNETYGALGAVAALLMWFWLSALAALTGAVLNAELELETIADTTVGPDRPLGERGAVVADTYA